jgi:hypothetical protein
MLPSFIWGLDFDNSSIWQDNDKDKKVERPLCAFHPSALKKS